MDEILRIKNLSKRYDDISVLENIDLSVKKGEVVVIVGPSGCGKSTLLRCLNGLEEIQEGEVLLDDEVVNPNKKNLSKNREKIGMVFQSYDLFPHLTCGYAPCDPFPVIVILKPSTEYIIVSLSLYIYKPIGIRPGDT